jgi:hypothetical protein
MIGSGAINHSNGGICRPRVVAVGPASTERQRGDPKLAVALRESCADFSYGASNPCPRSEAQMGGELPIQANRPTGAVILCDASQDGDAARRV